MKLPTNADRRSGVGRRVALIGLAIAAATAVIAAGGVASAADEPEGTIRSAGTTNVVKDSYVVTLKTAQVQASAVDTAAKDLTAKYGGQITQKYRSALRGFAVKGLGEKQARRLAADRNVESVQHDGIYTINDTQDNATWGL